MQLQILPSVDFNWCLSIRVRCPVNILNSKKYKFIFLRNSQDVCPSWHSCSNSAKHLSTCHSWSTVAIPEICILCRMKLQYVWTHVCRPNISVFSLICYLNYVSATAEFPIWDIDDSSLKHLCRSHFLSVEVFSWPINLKYRMDGLHFLFHWNTVP